MKFSFSFTFSHIYVSQFVNCHKHYNRKTNLQFRSLLKTVTSFEQSDFNSWTLLWCICTAHFLGQIWRMMECKSDEVFTFPKCNCAIKCFVEIDTPPVPCDYGSWHEITLKLAVLQHVKWWEEIGSDQCINRMICEGVDVHGRGNSVRAHEDGKGSSMCLWVFVS